MMFGSKSSSDEICGQVRLVGEQDAHHRPEHDREGEEDGEAGALEPPEHPRRIGRRHGTTLAQAAPGSYWRLRRRAPPSVEAGSAAFFRARGAASSELDRSRGWAAAGGCGSGWGCGRFSARGAAERGSPDRCSPDRGSAPAARGAPAPPPGRIRGEPARAVPSTAPRGRACSTRGAASRGRGALRPSGLPRKRARWRVPARRRLPDGGAGAGALGGGAGPSAATGAAAR